MKTNNKISAYILRGSTAVLLFSCVIVALCSAIYVPQQFNNKSLSFAERVAYQTAIEDIYWRHRIWPDTNRGPKPSLDAVMSQAQIEKKVTEYLRNSQTLEDQWERPITANQLQAEMERMATNTKQPEVLREIFDALGNDPFVIAECLARLVLVERLIGKFSSDAKDASFRAKSRNPAARLTANSTRSFDSAQDDIAANLPNIAYTLPEIPSDGCIDDTWTPTSTTNAPTGRAFHTAVWTGSEMIVWGGYDHGVNYWNTGGKYTPSTDSWTATTTTNAPTGRVGPTAVWTGSEMIVWGGTDCFCNGLRTGGRYNPGTNSWTATTNTNAPTGRTGHTAVWTGSEMIVWGGWNYQSTFNTGGRYNPSTDSWTATSTTNAPSPRNAPAVWDDLDNLMIVFGGAGDRTGGRYSPLTDSWTATSTINAPREGPTVWAGSEMIVWTDDSTGGRYSPGTDSWTATSTTNAPDPRPAFTEIWTGSELIVWGGFPGLNTGGRYNPSTDSWTATSTTNAPEPRVFHTAVWADTEMIVWGGQPGTGFNTGGRYCAAPLGPTPTPTPSSTPTATAMPTATPTATPNSTPRPTPTRRPRPTPAPHP